jgi:hypothetical protein
MIAEDEKPARDARKAKDAMNRAVGEIIDQKKHEPIGTEEAEQKVADDLHQAAEHDVKIHNK